MQNSNPNSMPPSNNNLASFFAHGRVKLLVYAMLAIAPIGFLDASYLTAEHFLNRVPPCSIVVGCERVTTSVYATVFGVPLALLGALYYLAIIIALVYYLDTKKEIVVRGVSLFTVCGFAFSLYLVGLQLFVIHAICLYCMLSALSSTALFVAGLMVLRSHQVYRRQKMATLL